MSLEIKVVCFDCFEADPRTGPVTSVRMVPQDEGPYFFTCEKGHQGVAIIQQMQIEVLFELGLRAILDGYPREAVADFAATLERHYELVAAVASRVFGVENAELTEAWKELSKQSERQLGAYSGLYLAMFKEPAPHLTKPMVAFRNNVVHRGIIPDEAAAIAFGQAVSDVVTLGLAKMWNDYPKKMEEVIGQHMSEQQGRIPPGYGRVSSMSWPAALSMTRSASRPIDVKSTVAQLRRQLKADGYLTW